MARHFLIYFVILTTQLYAQVRSYDIKDYEQKPYHVDTFPNQTMIFRFYSIHFWFDSDSIFKESYSELDSIADWLLKHETIKVEIGVHTDTRWTDEYSTCLSCKRARKIVEYLTRQGIKPVRMTSKGYNDKDPIFSEDYISKIKGTKEEEMAETINRRVEIRILDY